jgi:formate hydrogenlyase subunit 3/multisubunit Na+/H+ antiporter MnhD subunit
VRTGSRNTDDYRGLGRKMPLSGVLFVLATLSLIGVPPLFGFFTKFRILSAAAASGASGSWLGIGVILLGTVLEAVYLFRVYRVIFATVPSEEKDKKSKEMEWPAAVAVAAFVLIVVLGSLLIPMIPAGLAI